MGFHLRVSNYNMALAGHEKVSVKQFSYNTTYFNRQKMLSFNGGRYREYHLHSIIYTLLIIIMWPILRIRSWYFMIPHIFKLIRPGKMMKKKLDESDIIQAEGPWLVSWVKKYSDKPLVLIAHNVEYDLAGSILKHKNGFYPEFVKNIILRIMFEEEKKAVALADYIFCVSGEDMARLCELYGVNADKLKFIPSGVITEDYRVLSKEEKNAFKKELGIEKYEKIVLFTGSFHPPNVLAAHFITDVISSEFRTGNILFLIAGSVFNVQKRYENIFITGRISRDQLLKFAGIADIAINPVPYGSGSNIKMFEYLALHLPVISTENGIRGVVDRARGAMIACKTECFAQMLKKILSDESMVEKLKKEAIEGKKYHDYHYITGNALKYYEQAIYNYSQRKAK